MHEHFAECATCRSDKDRARDELLEAIVSGKEAKECRLLLERMKTIDPVIVREVLEVSP